MVCTYSCTNQGEHGFRDLLEGSVIPMNDPYGCCSSEEEFGYELRDGAVREEALTILTDHQAT